MQAFERWQLLGLADTHAASSPGCAPEELGGRDGSFFSLDSCGGVWTKDRQAQPAFSPCLFLDPPTSPSPIPQAWEGFHINLSSPCWSLENSSQYPMMHKSAQKICNQGEDNGC